MDFAFSSIVKRRSNGDTARQLSSFSIGGRSQPKDRGMDFRWTWFRFLHSGGAAQTIPGGMLSALNELAGISGEIANFGKTFHRAGLTMIVTTDTDTWSGLQSRNNRPKELSSAQVQLITWTRTASAANCITRSGEKMSIHSTSFQNPHNIKPESINTQDGPTRSSPAPTLGECGNNPRYFASRLEHHFVKPEALYDHFSTRSESEQKLLLQYSGMLRQYIGLRNEGYQIGQLSSEQSPAALATAATLLNDKNDKNAALERMDRLLKVQPPHSGSPQYRASVENAFTRILDNFGSLGSDEKKKAIATIYNNRYQLDTRAQSNISTAAQRAIKQEPDPGLRATLGSFTRAFVRNEHGRGRFTPMYASMHAAQNKSQPNTPMTMPDPANYRPGAGGDRPGWQQGMPRMNPRSAPVYAPSAMVPQIVAHLRGKMSDAQLEKMKWELDQSVDALRNSRNPGYQYSVVEYFNKKYGSDCGLIRLSDAQYVEQLRQAIHVDLVSRKSPDVVLRELKQANWNDGHLKDLLTTMAQCTVSAQGGQRTQAVERFNSIYGTYFGEMNEASTPRMTALMAEIHQDLHTRKPPPELIHELRQQWNDTQMKQWRNDMVGCMNAMQRTDEATTQALIADYNRKYRISCGPIDRGSLTRLQHLAGEAEIEINSRKPPAERLNDFIAANWQPANLAFFKSEIDKCLDAVATNDLKTYAFAFNSFNRQHRAYYGDMQPASLARFRQLSEEIGRRLSAGDDHAPIYNLRSDQMLDKLLKEHNYDDRKLGELHFVLQNLWHTEVEGQSARESYRRQFQNDLGADFDKLLSALDSKPKQWKSEEEKRHFDQIEKRESAFAALTSDIGSYLKEKSAAADGASGGAANVSNSSPADWAVPRYMGKPIEIEKMETARDAGTGNQPKIAQLRVKGVEKSVIDHLSDNGFTRDDLKKLRADITAMFSGESERAGNFGSKYGNVFATNLTDSGNTPLVRALLLDLRAFR